MSMLPILFFLFLLASTSHGWDPMENPDLFQGDMILTEKQKYEFLHGLDVDSNIPLAATNTRHWPKTIPYTIDSSLANEPSAVQVIAQAISDYEKFTCLTFKNRTNEPGYIEFYKGGGCSSPVGYFGRRNRISLSRGCWVKGIVMHEIAHSLGFYHEQSRPDRDSYVSINWGNIPSWVQHNFGIRKSSTIDSMNVPYDYDSVMHYGRYAFGRGKVTIETIDKSKTHAIGQRRGFSKLDVLQMNLLYRCPGFTKPPNLSTVKPATTSVAPIPGSAVRVDLRSEGCEDVNKSIGHQCGKATIKVNGKDYSKSQRGLNIVMVELTNGIVLGSASFDTHGDSMATARMSTYIDAIPSGSMVLIAAQDEASMNLRYPLTAKVRALGGLKISMFGYRGSYTLVGYKGLPFPYWVQDAYNLKKRGPTSLSTLVPIAKAQTTAAPPITLPPPLPTTTGRPVKPAQYVYVYVKSVACDDVKTAPISQYPCGRAVIKVNGADFSRARRGFNIVVIRLRTGVTYSSVNFDTHASAAASASMVNFLDRLENDSVILAAIQDEGSSALTMAAKNKLRDIGGILAPLLHWRSSYALIGYKGKHRPSWVKDNFNRRTKGPSELANRIAIGKASTSPPVPTRKPKTTRAITTSPILTPPLPTAVPGQCGISPVPQSRVIGGNIAAPGAWPWQIALLRGGRFICGGSLVNSLWIVTAAHCVSSSQASSYTVVLGEHNRYKKEGTEVNINVEKVIVHPSYGKPKRLNNDIALLKLVKPVQFTSRIQPVCLPSSSEVIPVGSKCFITGWGKIKHPGSSHFVLQQAMIPVRGSQECSKRLKSSPGGSLLEITDRMLCAGELGSATRKSGCHGDSGGPYVCQTASGAYQLHGAVSWGSPRCNIQERFTVFARITALKPWIDAMMVQN